MKIENTLLRGSASQSTYGLDLYTLDPKSNDTKLVVVISALQSNVGPSVNNSLGILVNQINLRYLNGHLDPMKVIWIFRRENNPEIDTYSLIKVTYVGSLAGTVELSSLSETEYLSIIDGLEHLTK